MTYRNVKAIIFAGLIAGTLAAFNAPAPADSGWAARAAERLTEAMRDGNPDRILEALVLIREGDPGTVDCAGQRHDCVWACENRFIACHAACPPWDDDCRQDCYWFRRDCSDCCYCQEAQCKELTTLRCPNDPEEGGPPLPCEIWAWDQQRPDRHTIQDASVRETNGPEDCGNQLDACMECVSQNDVWCQQECWEGCPPEDWDCFFECYDIGCAYLYGLGIQSCFCHYKVCTGQQATCTIEHACNFY